MLKIIGFQKYEKNDGSEFCTLTVSGGLEPVISSVTGKVYLTYKKANVPTTLDSEMCQKLVGTELSGTIEKVEVEPYDYTIPSTGNTITLNHRYEYKSEDMYELNKHVVKAHLVS